MRTKNAKHADTLHTLTQFQGRRTSIMSDFRFFFFSPAAGAAAPSAARFSATARRITSMFLRGAAPVS